MTILGGSRPATRCWQGIDLTGKRALVTGVSAGLGVETARALAAHGAEVIGTARDLEKARAATAHDTRWPMATASRSSNWTSRVSRASGLRPMPFGPSASRSI